MKRVVVVSDSHGLTGELMEIKNRHDADVYIHCGDSELAEEDVHLNGFTKVRGNCDWNSMLPDEEVIELDGLRIFITHGHLYNVKQTLQKLHYRALEKEAQIACFGHSHVAYVEQVGKTLLLNPGSIRAPRKFSTRSYAIIEWENKCEFHVQFYDLHGDKIISFPYDTSFSFHTKM